MTLNSADFQIHDVSHFPLVLTQATATPGYSAVWEKEMETLVLNQQAFVLILKASRADEEHEDRKRRGIWLKQNKQRLGALCKVLISVEPDGMRRAALTGQSAMAEKAFGIPMRVVDTLEEARTQGRRWLEH